MEKKVIEINLPFFDGFYESIFFNSDTLWYEFYDNEKEYKEEYGDDITVDDLDIDFKEYCNDICKEYVDVYFSYTPAFIEKLEFTEMTSPRQYNFETDKIYANATLSEDWREQILDFMKKNKDWVAHRVEKDWTSYDGFLSFMDNTYEDWLKRFENTEEEIDSRYLEVMVAYMMIFDDEDIRHTLAEYTLENVYVGSYIYCTKDKIENT